MNPNSQFLNLTDNELTIIRHILLPMKGYPIYAFGSRTKNTAREYSDLDLLIDSPSPINLSLISELKENFDESILPFKVDISERAYMSDEFYQRIQDDLILMN